MKIIISLVLILITFKLVIGDKNCHFFQSCYNTSVIADADINCYGYQSCSLSKLTVYGRSKVIDCGGKEGCANAKNITSLGGYISCNGDHSCYNAKYLSAFTWIYCGYYGCYGSKSITDYILFIVMVIIVVQIQEILNQHLIKFL